MKEALITALLFLFFILGLALWISILNAAFAENRYRFWWNVGNNFATPIRWMRDFWDGLVDRRG